MKFIILITLVSVASAAFSELKLEECGGDGSVTIREVDVSPMPIRMPGKLNVVLGASLSRDIHGPIVVKVKMYRKTWLGFVKFPVCIKDVGSCEYNDICERLEKLGERGCPREELAALGLDIPRCSCPLPAADIQVALRDIELPKLPKALSMFASGDYKVEARVYERGNHLVTCFKAYASLA